MKAQVALEYMIVFVTIFVALIPLVYLSFAHLSQQKAISDVNIAYDTMAASINQAFSLSPGSKITTRIFLPTSYSKAGSSVNSKILTLKFDMPDGNPLVISNSVIGNIEGVLPDHGGNLIFTFELQSNGKVKVDYIK